MSLASSSSFLASGLALGIRASVLLAVALVAWRIFRGRPLIGSLIAQAGLLGLILLPAFSWMVPTFSIPLIKAERDVSMPNRTISVVEVIEDEGARIDQSPEVGVLSHVETTVLSDRLPVPVAIEPREAGSNVRPLPSTGPSVDMASIAVATYAAVVLMMLARLLGSLVGVSRIRRSIELVDDPTWLDALDRLKKCLGIRRPVALARSSRVGVPAVVGWLRPMILLPSSSEAKDKTNEHAEAILLHELAHVRRGDYAWNVLLRVVEAVYWPHPLAWLLDRALAESRERACDAFCVHQLGGPSSYRAALLAMADRLSGRPGPALGLAMAGRSRLGRRVLEIDRGRPEPRCLPRWPNRVAILTLALASTAIVGPARITRAEPRPTAMPAPDPVVPIVQEPKKPAEPVRPSTVGKVFRLRVVAAETGKPVPNADVRVWMGFGPNDFRKADGEGRIDLTYATGPDDLHLGVDVWGDGFAMQRHNWGNDPKVPVPDEATIKLQPGESLGGIVQDEQGRPIAGAAVYLFSHNYKKKDPTELLYDLRAVTSPDGRWHTGGAPQTTGNLLGFYITHPDFISDREYVSQREKPPIEELRAGKALSVMKKGVPIQGRVLGADGKPVAGALVISTDSPGTLFNSVADYAVKTDAEGHFRTGQVKPGDWHLIIQAAGHAPAAREIKVGSAIPYEEIRLEASHVFRARVVNPSGRPVVGAFVNIDTWRVYRCLGVFLYTDANGAVRWDDAPEDLFKVNVDAQGYQGIFMQSTRVTGGEETFTLRPAIAISGIVRDSETRKGVERADLAYGAVDPASGEVKDWQDAAKVGWTMVSQGHLHVIIPVEADSYKFRITAQGYQPFISRSFHRDEKVVLNYDVALNPGQAGGPFATVIRPDGRPLSGARIYLGRLNANLSLNDGQVTGRDLGRQSLTDVEGKFPIPPTQPPALVLILGDDCFAYANAKALNDSARLQARPYARIEGIFQVGTRLHSNRPIELSGQIQDYTTSSVRVSYSQTATTDASGRFTFDKVVAMSGLRIARKDPRGVPGSVSTIGQPIRVEDGQTAVLTIGGKGRSVIGRVEPPKGWDKPVDFTDRCMASVASDRSLEPIPLELLRGKTDLKDQAWSKWSQAWRMTREGRDYEDGRVAISVALSPDGSFRIDDVPPGEYRVEVRVNGEKYDRKPSPFATLSTTMTIPPNLDGLVDKPLDLGRLQLSPRKSIKVGDPAPPIEVMTVEGNKLSIPGDFRGKYLLLDLGASWATQARLQIPRLNDVFARFDKDERFAIVSLLLDPDRPDSRAFVAGKGQPWPQAIVGAPSNPVSDAYDFDADQFDVPAAILIGPDGRIVARDLFYQKIGEAIAGALGIKEAPVPR
jgi:beta-lactamase regulating signal transducer with metallopeptidase domain